MDKLKLKNFSNFGASSVAAARSFAKNLSSDPYTDWALTVAVAFVIAVVMIFFGLTDYGRAARGDILGTVVAPKKIEDVFDTTALTQTLRAIDARAAERQSLLRGYSGPGDPSL
ncbi:hypothetical protein KGQ27_03925 [Patescibacteria group bacterium]|nr:hypothetical protein [Patescibacteria group bacterium]MDE1946925.1 hypothetical protein [Patescibacteria group bacterium]MDE2011126.1 hypothetical protein [Patescibacteria group bacterium]MDE2233183.1 hypothetical protein [Patescibacteria group bacterium]